MKTRRLLMALFMIAVFYYLTTHQTSLGARLHLPWSQQAAGNSPWSAPSWISRPTKIEITEAAQSQSFDAEEQNNISVYKRVLPSVVNITSTAVTFDFFYGAQPQQGQGSGFILDKEGHILTNYHVVAGARQVEVTLSNRKKYKAAIIGVDKNHDLAIVQITGADFAPAILGDSKGLVVGQKVYAIGNPFGLSGTMTRGIISSIRSIRTQDGGGIDEAIQTDAAINPGNSGGPLLNAHGDVVGINTLIATGGAEQSSGVGFAIPINTAKAVLNDLLTLGTVQRPSLGVRGLLPIGPELADQLGLAADSGVLVQQVIPGGPADRAGLRGGTERAYLGNVQIVVGGDLIVAIDGNEVTDNQDISHALNNHRAGDTMRVTIYRGKRRLDLDIKLGEARTQQT